MIGRVENVDPSGRGDEVVSYDDVCGSFCTASFFVSGLAPHVSL